MNNGFAIRPDSSVTPAESPTCSSVPEDLSRCWAFLTRQNPDLAKLLQAWQALPKSWKPALLTLIQAAQAVAGSREGILSRLEPTAQVRLLELLLGRKGGQP